MRTDHDVRVAIDLALAATLADWHAPEGADTGDLELARHAALAPLRALSDDVLTRHVLPLAESPRIEERALVADVLRWARAREQDWPSRSRTYATFLLALADRESDPTVLSACIAAFVDLRDRRGVALAARHARHDDPAVRCTIAGMLVSYVSSELLAVTTLLVLSTDADAETRDWATFGLASCLPWPASSIEDPQVCDPEVIRQALHARVDDPDESCRGEAWIGLARARDPRVIPLIHDALAGRRTCWLALEAIEEWPRREYVEALARRPSRWSERALLAASRACERASEGPSDVYG
jgi:hypothetical protein